jgi:hypothetical protein
MLKEIIMVCLSIIFFILAVANFVFAGYYFYESRKRADKISKKTVDEINEGAEQKVGSKVTINANIISLGQYDFSKVIKTINSYIDNFNKTNKNVNRATV